MLGATNDDEKEKEKTKGKKKETATKTQLQELFKDIGPELEDDEDENEEDEDEVQFKQEDERGLTYSEKAEWIELEINKILSDKSWTVTKIDEAIEQLESKHELDLEIKNDTRKPE